jgi:hypothetical protein
MAKINKMTAPSFGVTGEQSKRIGMAKNGSTLIRNSGRRPPGFPQFFHVKCTISSTGRRTLPYREFQIHNL